MGKTTGPSPVIPVPKTSLNQLIQAGKAIDAAQKESNEKVIDALKDFMRISSCLEVVRCNEKEERAYLDAVEASAATLLGCLRNHTLVNSTRCFASTTFVRFLNPIIGDVHMVSVALALLRPTGCRLTGLRITRDDKLQGLKFVHNDDNESYDPDFNLAIFHGLFGKTTHRLMKVERNGESLHLHLFPSIFKLCVAAPMVATFKILHRWCEIAHISIPTSSDLKGTLIKNLFDVYILVAVHMRNSISGLTQVLTTVLNTTFGHPSMTRFVTSLAEQYSCENYIPPWRSKNVLHVVSALVTNAPSAEVAKEYSMLGCILLQCARDGTLSGAATEVYLATLKRLEWSEWQHVYGKAFSLAVYQGNVNVMLTHWLEPTLHRYGQEAVDYFTQKLNLSTEPAHRLLLGVERLANSLGLKHDRLTSGSHSFLDCESNQLRLEAFDTMCDPPNLALATLPSVQVMGSLGKFMVDNVYVDDPAFRADFLKIIPKFFVRLRLGMERFALEEKPENRVEVMAAARLIDKVVCLFKEQCHAASTYQRKVTSLGIMKVLLDVLLPERPTVVKGANFQPGRHEALKKLLKRLGFSWEFTDDQDVKRILLMCSADEDDGIRKDASSMLIKYFTLDDETLHDVRAAALVMVGHSEPQVSEGGAGLSCLVLKQVQKRSTKDAGGTPELTAGKIWNEAVEALASLTTDLASVERNHATAMLSRPIHGNLFHVRKLIPCMAEHLTNEDVKRLITLSRDIAVFCFRILTNSDDFPRHCPSFEEISCAVKTHIDRLHSSDGDEIEGLVVSEEQQKVIFFCCLSMKESALLLGELSLVARGTKKGSIFEFMDWKEIGELLLNLLLFNRQKGAIEAAAVAMGQFTSSMLESPTDDKRKFIRNIVDRSLATVTCKDNPSSATRRGAGFPLLFSSIVGNLPKNSDLSLFKDVCSTLCMVHDKEAERRDTAGWNVPDATAMFILQKLVEDSSLAPLVIQYATELFNRCADYLESNIWSNRNAALLLLGSLTKRLFGPGKEQSEVCDVVDVEDQTSSYGYYEFALQHPKIMERIFNLLAGRGFPVVPILSFISNLDIRCSVITKDILANSSGQLLLLLCDWVAVFEPLILSPIMAVRKLAAHCAAQFLDMEQLVVEWSRWLLGFGRWYSSLVSGQPDEFPDPKLPRITTVNDAHGCLIHLRRILLAIGRQRLTQAEYNMIDDYLGSVKGEYVGDLVVTELLKLRRVLLRFFAVRVDSPMELDNTFVVHPLIDGPGGLMERLTRATCDSNDPGFEAWKEEVVRFAFESIEPNKVCEDLLTFPRHGVILIVMQHLMCIGKLDSTVFKTLVSLFDMCPGYLRLDDSVLIRGFFDLAPFATDEQLPTIFRLVFDLDANAKYGIENEVDMYTLLMGKGDLLDHLYLKCFPNATCPLGPPATLPESEKLYCFFFVLHYEALVRDPKGDKLERVFETIARDSASLDPVVRLAAARSVRIMGPVHAKLDHCSIERSSCMIANLTGTLVRLLHDENAAVRREAARAASNIWELQTSLGPVWYDHAAPATRRLIEFLGIRLTPTFRLAVAWNQLSLNPYIDRVSLDPPPMYMRFPADGKTPELPYERWHVLRFWYRVGMAALEECFPDDVAKFGPWLKMRRLNGDSFEYNEPDRIIAVGPGLINMQREKTQEMLDIVRPSKIRCLKKFGENYRAEIAREFMRRSVTPTNAKDFNDIVWF